MVKHLSSSIYSFNEEVGEVMFAQLARTVLGDTDQSSLAKLQEAYKAQPYVAAFHLSPMRTHTVKQKTSHKSFWP